MTIPSHRSRIARSTRCRRAVTSVAAVAYIAAVYSSVSSPTPHMCRPADAFSGAELPRRARRIRRPPHRTGGAVGSGIGVDRASSPFPTTSDPHRDTALSALPDPSALAGSLVAAASPLFASLLKYNGNVPFVQALGLNALLFALLSRKLFTMLTPTGFAHSLALGACLWTALGWRGWTVCVIYLFLGQLVTKVGFAEKEALGIAEGRGGRRGPENVWGSALTGLVCAACAAKALTANGAFFNISADAWLLGYVASLATKLSDTFASEIGKAYGKTTFLITTFERVSPGTEGAVSLEGSLASVAGGFALSTVGYALGFTTPAGVVASTIAAFLATNVESVLGATLQGKEGLEWITNEVVNFLNTLIGAMIAIATGVWVLGL